MNGRDADCNRAESRYHDSKLTELLSSALGGNSKTTIVVTASPEPRHATETLQALRFGEACAVVQNQATDGLCNVAHLLRELETQIADTERAIEGKEKWVRIDEVQQADEFGEGGGGIRTITKAGTKLLTQPIARIAWNLKYWDSCFPMGVRIQSALRPSARCCRRFYRSGASCSGRRSWRSRHRWGASRPPRRGRASAAAKSRSNRL